MPNVETLVFLPDLRILPMHLTPILPPATLTCNSMLFQRPLMVQFGSLKSFAEHWSIRITADVDGPPVQTAPELWPLAYEKDGDSQLRKPGLEVHFLKKSL